MCLMREKMVRELQNLNYGIFRSDRKSEEDTYLVSFLAFWVWEIQRNVKVCGVF